MNRIVAIVIVIAAFVLLTASLFTLGGCATPIERWQTSMAVYTAGNNTVAAALDEGKIKLEHAKTYRDAARVARAALDAWLLSISPDGLSDDGAARATANDALAEARRWLARVLTKQ